MIVKLTRTSQAHVVVWEMGRGPGGRAAVRRSRAQPSVCIPHGAPAFTVSSDRFAQLVDELADSGVVDKWADVQLGRALCAQNDISWEHVSAPGLVLYHGKPDFGRACSHLLEESKAECHFQSVVDKCSWQDGRWLLSVGDTVHEFDSLVVTSHSAAHSRWKQIFGRDPPLEAVANERPGDEHLTSLLAGLAKIESKPVYSLLLSYIDRDAAAWNKLPYDLVHVENHPILRKLVIVRDGAAPQRSGCPQHI